MWHKGKKTNILALIIIIIKGTDGAQMGHRRGTYRAQMGDRLGTDKVSSGSSQTSAHVSKHPNQMF